jgi:DNA-binding MarR family transcriptional regulator
MGGRLQVHPTSVTNVVDGLEGLGLVQRAKHQQDRRTTLACITDEGRSTAVAATDALNEARFGTQPLEDDELRAISNLIQRLRRAADHSLTSQRYVILQLS